jgi:hypothetical protein
MTDIKDRIKAAAFCGMTHSLRDDLCEMLDELWHEAAQKDAEIERLQGLLKNQVPITECGNYVFIDGAGLRQIDHDGDLERALPSP